MTSLRRGIDDGADRVEFDIHRTSDGHYVAIHDGELSRTTNGEGEVGRRPLSYINGLDAGDGAPPPNLIEVLRWARTQKVRLVVEVKEAQAHELAEILRNSGVEDLWVISFDHEFIKEFSQLAPEYPTGHLYSAKPARIRAGLGALAGTVLGGLAGPQLGLPPLVTAGVSGLAGLVLGWTTGKGDVRRAAARQTADLVLPHHSLVDRKLLESVSKPVIPYTVNQPDRGRALVEQGVAGLITDYPERFVS